MNNLTAAVYNSNPEFFFAGLDHQCELPFWVDSEAYNDMLAVWFGF